MTLVLYVAPDSIILLQDSQRRPVEIPDGLQNHSRHVRQASSSENCDTVVSPNNQQLFCKLKETLAVTFHPPVAPVRSCAFVSSSGELLLHSNGQDIDSHDAVIRINHAPASLEFADIAGIRDDIRFMGCSHPLQKAWLLEKNVSSRNSRAVDVITGESDCDSLYAPSKILFHTIDNFKSLPLRLTRIMRDFLPRAFAEDINKPGGRSGAPTSGSNGLAAALSFCHQVDVYGMYDAKLTYQDEYYFTPTPHTAGLAYLEFVSKCVILDLVRLVLPWIWLGPMCSNGGVHDCHALRPVEHELFAQISANSPEQIRLNGKMSIPGFSCIDCSGVDVDSFVPSEMQLDLGTLDKEGDFFKYYFSSDQELKFDRFRLVANRSHKKRIFLLALFLLMVVISALYAVPKFNQCRNTPCHGALSIGTEP